MVSLENWLVYQKHQIDSEKIWTIWAETNFAVLHEWSRVLLYPGRKRASKKRSQPKTTEGKATGSENDLSY